MTTSLFQLQKEAKQIAQAKKTKYNEELQFVSQTKGYKNYQSLLNTISNNFINAEKTDSGVLEDIKQKLFKNRKVFINKIKNLNKLRTAEDKLMGMDADDDELESINEELENIDEQALSVATELASSIVPDYLIFKIFNNGMNMTEGCSIAIYRALYDTDYQRAHNDFDGSESDFSINFSYDTNDIKNVQLTFYEDIQENDSIDFLEFDMTNPIYFEIDTLK